MSQKDFWVYVCTCVSLSLNWSLVLLTGQLEMQNCLVLQPTVGHVCHYLLGQGRYPELQPCVPKSRHVIRAMIVRWRWWFPGAHQEEALRALAALPLQWEFGCNFWVSQKAVVAVTPASYPIYHYWSEISWGMSYVIVSFCAFPCTLLFPFAS